MSYSVTDSLIGVDGISSSKKLFIKNRDGNKCVVCGYEVVDVVHILGGPNSTADQIETIMTIAPDSDLKNFQKDGEYNLISLCPNHHAEYKLGLFILLPSPETRVLLKNYEEEDFTRRQEHANKFGTVPNRKLPFLLATKGIEYVPINFSYPERMCIHSPTPWDDDLYPFDVGNHLKPVIAYPNASAFALLWESNNLLTPTVLINLKANQSVQDALELLEMYHRKPQVPAGTRKAIPAAAGSTQREEVVEAVLKRKRESSGSNSRKMLRPQQEPVSDPENLPIDRQSRITSSRGEDIDEDHLDAHSALSSYQDEPSVTPEALDARTPLRSGKPTNGRWWEYALYGF